MAASVIFSEGAPRPIGPYSQAIRTGNMIFTAGQIALTGDGTLLAGGAAEQTHQAIANLRAVLTAGGAGLENVVKTTIFLQSMDDFTAVNEVYAQYFTASAPARSTVEVARLPKNALVEIEAIAVIE
jgi:2-iminobutanoate/2-iminopropanoate deaminase